MKRAKQGLGRGGFTLIEILVALILLALTVAAVFPVVTQQLGAADAPILGNDLAAVRTAVQSYVANTKQSTPRGIEDLVVDHSIATGWNGPYLDFDVTSGTASDVAAHTSGSAASLTNAFFCIDTSADPTGASASVSDQTDGGCTNQADWLAVQITGLDSDAYTDLEDAIDDGTSTTGKVRGGDDNDPAYFLLMNHTK